MKRFIALVMTLACFAICHAEPPTERVVLLVGTTPEAQESAAKITDFLIGSGPFTVVEMGTEEAAQFQSSPEATYLIRQLDRQIVWQRPVLDAEATWTEFQQSQYDIPEGRLLGWSHVEPADAAGPLRLDELVEFYAGGQPGLQVTGTLGGKTVPLFEERPGYYVGAYRVVSEDRVEANVSISATQEDGLVDTREHGQMKVEALLTPTLTGLGQINRKEWVLQGEATPGSTVEISIAIRRGTLFGAKTKRRKVEAVADEDGKFEAVAKLGSLSSSPKGKVKLVATDQAGVAIQSEEMEVRFRSRVRRVYIDPWGYRGFWGGPFNRRGICW